MPPTTSPPKFKFFDKNPFLRGVIIGSVISAAPLFYMCRYAVRMSIDARNEGGQFWPEKESHTNGYKIDTSVDFEGRKLKIFDEKEGYIEAREFIGDSSNANPFSNDNFDEISLKYETGSSLEKLTLGEIEEIFKSAMKERQEDFQKSQEEK